MAKQSGLGDYVAVDDSGGTVRDLSTDVTSYEIANSQNLLDSTSISKSAMERIVGVGDGSITLNGVFDAASNLAHDVFKLKTGTRTVTVAIGNPSLSMECLVADYNLSRGDDASLTWTATLNVSNGTVPTWGTV